MKHIPDLLWNELKKLILQKKNNVGRPEFDSRKRLNGIIYILNGVNKKEGHQSPH